MTKSSDIFKPDYGGEIIVGSFVALLGISLMASFLLFFGFDTVLFLALCFLGFLFSSAIFGCIRRIEFGEQIVIKYYVGLQRRLAYEEISNITRSSIETSRGRNINLGGIFNVADFQQMFADVLKRQGFTQEEVESKITPKNIEELDYSGHHFLSSVISVALSLAILIFAAPDWLEANDIMFFLVFFLLNLAFYQAVRLVLRRLDTF